VIAPCRGQRYLRFEGWRMITSFPSWHLLPLLFRDSIMQKISLSSYVSLSNRRVPPLT
jgi:hypothetical protein